jgi:hypothetical protein
MRKPIQCIGTPPEVVNGRRIGGTGSINFVALCSKCRVPCLPGEVSQHRRPDIRWGEYRNGKPVCDLCRDGATMAPNVLEKEYQRIMKNTYEV